MEYKKTKNRETIIYRGQKYHRYPEAKTRQHRVYYWKHDKNKKAPIALHRQIWIDNFGEIPKGFVIHHKSHNPLDNSIENLEKKSFSKHAKDHMSTPERKKLSSETAKKQGTRLYEAGAVWRKTKEGIEFNRKNVVGSLQFKEPKFFICRVCKKEFKSTIRNAVFCSAKCSNWYSNHKGGNFVYGKEIICPICGTIFIADKNHRKYCSKRCRNKYSNDKARAKKKSI